MVLISFFESKIGQDSIDLGSNFYFVSIFLGEIRIQLVTFRAALPLPVHTHPVRPHQTQRHLVPVAQQSSFGQEVDSAGDFSLKFQGKYPWVLQTQANHRKERPASGKYCCRRVLVPKLCVEERPSFKWDSFKKTLKRYCQNLGQTSKVQKENNLELALFLANRTYHWYEVCIFIK